MAICPRFSAAFCNVALFVFRTSATHLPPRIFWVRLIRVPRFPTVMQRLCTLPSAAFPDVAAARRCHRRRTVHTMHLHRLPSFLLKNLHGAAVPCRIRPKRLPPLCPAEPRISSILPFSAPRLPHSPMRKEASPYGVLGHFRTSSHPAIFFPAFFAASALHLTEQPHIFAQTHIRFTASCNQSCAWGFFGFRTRFFPLSDFRG